MPLKQALQSLGFFLNDDEESLQKRINAFVSNLWITGYLSDQNIEQCVLGLAIDTK